MFDPDFYPTPQPVIDYMVNGADLAGKYVLEPSAGSGKIIDALHVLGAHVSACEINKELSLIVRSKADRFVSDNFLKVNAEDISHINMIYMNPPFSADDQHILHAYDIAPPGCEIAALCNWQTLANCYTHPRRKLKKIIDNYGMQECLGPVFQSAERKTDVEVGLVRLFKPGNSDNFEEFFDYTPDEEEAQGNGMLPYNAVREVVQRYVNACKLYDQVAENAVKMNSLIGQLQVSDIAFVLSDKDKEGKIGDFKVELQKKAWNWIFRKMNMERFMTESLRRDLNDFVQKQQNVPFTMKNIYRMFEMVVGTHGQRMNKVLIEVFDNLTYYHHDNRYDLEGWKTNSHYLVNKKFILPYVFNYGWGGYLEAEYRSRQACRVDDLIKALDYLTAEKRWQEIGDFHQWSRKARMQPNEWHDCAYFEIKGFKKGTMHAKFKDEKLWERFNRAVAEAKGYELPEVV